MTPPYSSAEFLKLALKFSLIIDGNIQKHYSLV